MIIKNKSNNNFDYLTRLIIFLANIILIGLIIYEQKNEDSLSNDKKKNILYSELILSFIGSFVLLLWMSYLLIIPFSNFSPFYFIYSLVLILTSPFALIIIRSFLQNPAYVKNITIFLFLSLLFNMMFIFGAGR
jgi:hypothetical protein